MEEGRGPKVPKSKSLKVPGSEGPRVPRCHGAMVPGSKGPRYLKVKFKYKLDSKEGPSCSIFIQFCRYLICHTCFVAPLVFALGKVFA